jgi:PAS domain S-box-containing protein
MDPLLTRLLMTSSSSSRSLESTVFYQIVPLASLILLAIVGISSYRVLYTLRDEVQERVDTSAQHAAQQIEINLHAVVSACKAIAGNDLVVNGIVDIDHRNSTLKSFFASLRLPGPQKQEVTMADYKGRVIVSTDRNAEGYTDAPWYATVMEGRHVVDVDDRSLIVAVPVLYGDRAEAVIVAGFDLVEFVADRFSASEHEAVVFFSSDEVLYSTESSLVASLQELQEQDGHLIGTATVNNLPNHQVSYLETERTALAAAREMAWSQLVLFGVLLTGLVAAIRLAARLAGEPLTEMLGQVGKIEKTGDLGLRVGQQGPREIQTLAKGFNSMIGNLEQTTVSQEQYRASEERLSFAIQGTNDGLWDWNMVTNEVWYSPRYKAMLGFSDEELPDQLSSFEDHLHPDDAESTWDAVDQHLKESAEYDVEHRLKTKSGEWKWVRARGAVTRDTDGKPVRMSGSMQDISEIKRFQTELQNTKFELEKVLDSLPIALIYASPDRKIMRVNRVFTEVFGYTEDEAIGQSTKMLYADPEEFRRQGQKRFNLEAKVSVTPYEIQYKRRDASRFTGESVGTVVFDAEDKPIGMLGLITDVSQRKAAERDLRINKFAVDNASDAVFWIESDGSFSNVNQQAANYLGYSKDELCRLGVSDINPAFPSESWGKHWAEVRQRRVLRFQSTHQRKNGSTYDCAIARHFLSFEGKEIIFATVRDITFEKEAEAALVASKRRVEESEKRFRAMADSAAPLCWITELDTTCSWLNKRWVEYSGKSLEEQTGFGWVETVHPDDRELAEAIYLDAFERRDAFELLYRLRRHDGVYRWHTVNATPRLDENGKFVGFVGMSFDTHEAKESREALEESELALKDVGDSLRATLDLLGTSDGVWDWKIDTQESLYTQGFRKILGFEGDDLDAFPDLLDSFDSRIHPDDRAELWKEIDRSFADRVPFAHEFRIRCKNENYIWVRSRGCASFDQDGEPVHLVGSIYDISAQKDVELERDRFLATAAELYAAVDLDSLRWVKLNAAWSSTLGYDPEKLLELPVPAVHPVGEHDSIRQQVNRLKNGEPARRWVTQTLHQDGSIRYIEWNIDPPTEGESVVYGAGRDVTEVREYVQQIEETTRQLETLNTQYEQSNNDLAQFAYVASHDLQEPLRAVAGFLQLLQKHYTDQLDETATGYIEKSVAGAARMSALINDLLYYSRVANADSNFNNIRLNDCVDEAIEKLGDAIASSKAKVQVEKLPEIRGIRLLLVQLFQNLIGNAIKYRGEQNPVVEIWAESTGEEIYVHIQDNGIGIPDAYREQVFDLFKRLHHRADYAGTGIGLAICQRVVERHGGKISVKSADGQTGAWFSICLPCKTATSH